MFKLKLAKNKEEKSDEWPYRCSAHNQPTGLLCSRCLEEPLCLKCARRNHGLPYICGRCEAELKARYAENARQTQAARAAAR